MRLRWLSNYFEIYLRSTDNIVCQHVEALNDIHIRMAAIAISVKNFNELADVSDEINLVMNDLEDED